jgi:hypothetical protein
MENKTNIAIADTAKAIAPILERKGLRITRGSAGKGKNNGFTRIYLETLENTTHDPRAKNYNDTVIRVWEWKTKSAGYFTPLTSKKVVKFLNELTEYLEYLD